MLLDGLSKGGKKNILASLALGGLDQEPAGPLGNRGSAKGSVSGIFIIVSLN